MTSTGQFARSGLVSDHPATPSGRAARRVAARWPGARAARRDDPVARPRRPDLGRGAGSRPSGRSRRALGLSRATVTTAYDQLRERGLPREPPGLGQLGDAPWRPPRGAGRDRPRGPGSTCGSRRCRRRAVLDELFARRSRELPRWLDHHGYDPLGLPPLREAIAARFTARGLPTRPEQILVTNGAMHALDLSIRATLRRGQRALVEIPSYPAALDALRAAGAAPDAVPVSARRLGPRDARTRWRASPPAGARVPDPRLPEPDRRGDRTRPRAGARCARWSARARSS